jgi:hypothetical protein
MQARPQALEQRQVRRVAKGIPGWEGPQREVQSRAGTQDRQRLEVERTNETALDAAHLRRRQAGGPTDVGQRQGVLDPRRTEILDGRSDLALDPLPGSISRAVATSHAAMMTPAPYRPRSG